MLNPKIVTPFLLSLGACSEAELTPRQLNFETVSFGDNSYRLCDLANHNRPIPKITEVNNEASVRERLVDLKEGLLKLATLSGSLLEHHEQNGELDLSTIELFRNDSPRIQRNAEGLGDFLMHEKYLGEIDVPTQYICGTGLSRRNVVYGVNDTKREEIAFKVTDANALVMNSVKLLENIEVYLSRREATKSIGEDNNAQKAWEATRRIGFNVGLAFSYYRDLENLSR